MDWNALVVGPVIGVFADDDATTPGAKAKWSYQSPTGEPAFDVIGVFDEAFRAVNPTGDAALDTAGPMLGVQLSAFAVPPAQGGELTRAATGRVYQIRRVQPDGRGGAALLLNYARGP